jgi:hypothetical protein
MFFLIALLSQELLAETQLILTPMGNLQITPGVAVQKQIVAEMTINADSGYSVTVRDANNGYLKNGIYSLPYLFSYATQDNIVLTITPLEVERNATGIVNGFRELSISIDAQASVGIAAGRYSDTVILEISGL